MRDRLDGLVRAYARLVVRRPLVPLLIAALLSAASVPGLLRVRFASDLASLFPDGPAATSAAALRDYLSAFAGREPIVTLFTGADPEQVRRAAERFRDRAARHAEVASAVDRIETSEATTDDPAIVVGDVLRLGDVRLRRRLEERLAPDEIDRAVARARTLLLAPGGSALAPDVRLDPLGLRGLLSSSFARLGAGIGLDDERRLTAHTKGRARPYAALVLVRARSATLDLDAAERVLGKLGADARAVGATTATPTAASRLAVAFTGPAAMGPAVRAMIKRDLTTSSVVASVLVVLVFLVTFRRGRAALAVVPPLALGGAWTTAAAGFALPGLDAITVAFGAIVLGLGADAGIHLYARILQARETAGVEPERAIEEAVVATVPTVLAATAATAVAFGALGLAELRPVRHLGWLGALGDVLTCASILLLVPPIAVLLERRARRSRVDGARPGAGASAPWIARCAASIAGARSRAVAWLVVAASVAVVGTLAAVGPPPLARSMVSVRPASLAPLRTQDELFARFGGRPGQWLALVGPGPREEVLVAGDRVAERLAALQAVGRVAGYEALTTIMPAEATQRARLEGRPRASLERAARLLGESLERRGFARAPFEPAIEALRSPSMRTTPVAAHSVGGALLLDRHLARTRDGWLAALPVHPPPGAEPAYLASVLTSALRDVRVAGRGVVLTGYPLLEAEVATALRRSFPWVAGVAALLVLVVVVIALGGGGHARSPVSAAAAAFVALAAIVAELALVMIVLRVAGVSLDAYALLALPVVVGITIDETLFVLHATRARTEGAADVRERVAGAVRETGRATLGTTATAVAAFAPLVGCEFDGLRSIGWVGATGAASGLVVALVVVPALVRVLGPTASSAPAGDPRSGGSR